MKRRILFLALMMFTLSISINAQHQRSIEQMIESNLASVKNTDIFRSWLNEPAVKKMIKKKTLEDAYKAKKEQYEILQNRARNFTASANEQRRLAERTDVYPVRYSYLESAKSYDEQANLCIKQANAIMKEMQKLTKKMEKL